MKVTEDSTHDVTYSQAYYHNGYVYCTIANNTNKRIKLSIGNISIEPGSYIEYFESEPITEFYINSELVRVINIDGGN